MPQIQKIIKLNHPGVLRDFKWTKGLPEFGKYNLIYGPNASGKTTISRIFRQLERGSIPTIDVKICINGQDITGRDFSERSNFPIRVFNRDFVSENVFHNNQMKGMPHILVLGQESIQKQKRLEKLYEERMDMESDKSGVQDRLTQTLEGQDRHSSGRARKIKDTLLQYDSNRYRNYTKRNYETRLQEIAHSSNVDAYILTPEKHIELSNRIRENPKQSIDEISVSILPTDSLKERVDDILAETVQSRVIQSFRENIELGSWVQAGLELHKEHGSENCLFCNQPMPEQRLSDLEGHFNDAYNRLVKRIDSLIEECESNMDMLVDIDENLLPSWSDFYEQLREDYESVEESVRQAFIQCRDFFKMLVNKLKKKKERLFVSMELGIEVPVMGENPITMLNEIIREHNELNGEFQIRKNKAIKCLEDGLIVEKYDEFQSYADNAEKLRTEQKSLEEQLQENEKEINDLENKIKEYHRPAEELNNELQEYLGHNELRLEAKDTGYQIMRGSSPGDALSEGEKTALALLYFLKTLEDRRFNLNDGIVVLDDPVSSLDSNSLYLAFGYIKNRTRDASQLFVMTHNFIFFQNVKKWFNYAGKKHHTSRFYMLNIISGSRPRQTELTELSSLLKDYHSEYHYLFSQIYQRVHGSSSIENSHESDYKFANIARRIMEMFFAFRQPHIQTDNSFYKKMDLVDFDPVKKERIYRFVNINSHAYLRSISEHNASVLCEIQSILGDILELIESCDEKHYECMKNVMKNS